MVDVLASEWRKLRSVRSTLYVLGTVAAFLLLCALWCWYLRGYWDGLTPERQAHAKAAAAAQPLLLALPVCGTVLGAVAITSEYATGMIRASLAAVPRRGTLFAAKAAVVGALMLGAGVVSMAAAALVGEAIVGKRPIPAFEMPLADQAAHVLSFGLLTAATALMAFGAGAVLRSTAGTISTLLALLLVLPPVLNLLPGPWGDRLWAVLPASLAEQMALAPGASPDSGPLSPAVACGVLVAYIAVALGAGAFSFIRRDS
ncbi:MULTISPECIES: ABC transporter permease [Thermomonosporaceae]|uniref:ABC transporter permease n=1 Tax=Thermomonosporaceae TaxID=2012 RepID=UPI00255A7B5D|nr:MULTISPECIES: ABC transporter permease [Thermomonosporaceae]MDL4770617.1 ABC transporter permease subunit [Actinomadura xylanilytica]